MEIWKPVLGYEGLYEVSNLGNVRSLDRLCEGRDGRLEIHWGKQLKPQTLYNGYLEVYLSDRTRGRNRKHRTVHSLVAEAFHGPRAGNQDIMHLDGNRANNRADNLCYGTRSENLVQTYQYGGRIANGKLTKEQASDVITRLMSGTSPTDLAREYGVNSAAIYHIKNKTTFKWLWKELGYAT
jgi:hypothetical protein